MSDSSLNNNVSNPFANLFDNVNDIQSFVVSSKAAEDSLKMQKSAQEAIKLNATLEKVFRITVRNDFDSNDSLFSCVFVDLGSDSDSLLTKDNIDEVSCLFFF